MRKLIFVFSIIINLKITGLYANNKIIYYCEFKQNKDSRYFKTGYFDRPCDIIMSDEKFVMQKILLLENYKKNYKIYNYEQQQILNKKQQLCNKISEQIKQMEKLLVTNKNNKILFNKLKRKLIRYKKLKQKNCKVI